MILLRLFFALCMLRVGGCYQTTIPTKNFFLPKNFTGNVAVIYSNTNETVQQVYDFVIPDSGVLVSKHPFHKGYYVTNFLQNRDELLYDTLTQALPGEPNMNGKNRVFFYRILTFQRGDSGPKFTVATFYLGNKVDSMVIREKFFFERKLEEIILGQ